MKTMLPDVPLARFAVVHVSADVTVAVWGALSSLVQVTTSPAFAVMVAGLKAKSAIVAVTVPVSVDGAHASVGAPLSEATGDVLAGASLADAPLVGTGLDVVPPEQADTTKTRAAAIARERVRDICASSWFGVRGSCLGSVRGYAQTGGVVS